MISNNSGNSSGNGSSSSSEEKLLLRVVETAVVEGKCSFTFVSFIATEEVRGKLILTTYIKNGSAHLARNFSEVDSAHFKGIKSYSGFITVNEKYNSNLFFWYFPKSNASLSETPWIIWLQGGPGYSSLKGLFDLMGPVKIINGKVTKRHITWARDYSLLFLDNPVGAGFSFTDHDKGYPDNEDDVGAQMYKFLIQFLQVFPELRKAPLFIAGESYAGKYVPALGKHIHRHRRNNSINLRGLMIGNGLVDPRSMMHYSELCGVIGILDDAHLKMLKKLEESVVQYIDNKEMVNAANALNETIEYIKKHSGVSVYNYEKDPDDSTVEFEKFLTRTDVKEWIHVGNASFDLNNQLVYEKMLPDIMNTTKPWLEDLLEYYGVLSYSGQLDIILAYSLSKHMYADLLWSRKLEYERAPRVRLRRSKNDFIVGFKKSGGNFVEVLIRNAGHATMAEQPEVTKFVVNRFIDDFK